MTSARRKIGTAIMGMGVALLGVGVLAGGASAQGEKEIGEQGFECPASSYTFSWSANVDEDADAISGAGTTYSDGTFTVTLSNAGPTVGEALDYWHVGSLDFDANSAVSAVQLQLWQPGNTFIYETVTFDPEVTDGTLTSPDGSLGEGQAPIKGLVFCFETKVAPTTTTTTTVAPTTTTVQVSPDVVTVPSTTTTTTTTITPAVAPVEVLPQVETAPQQIAFTGSSSGPLVLIGGVLVFLGLSLVTVDRLGIIRRGRHSR